MFSDPTFWVAVAFIVFVAAVFRPVGRMMMGGLDGRIDKIRAQLDEAQDLREQAQKTLAEYKHKQRDAVHEAARIVENAKQEVERMREQAEKDLEASLARRAQQAEEKIRQAEAAAVADVRRQAVDLAMAATTKLLQENLDQGRSEALVDQSIEEISQKLN